MGTRRPATLLLAVALAATGCRGATGPAPHPPDPDGRHVVGYFPSWRTYQRDYQVRDVAASGAADRLTHLVYAFGKVADGRCAPGDPYADLERPFGADASVDGVADAPGQRLRGNLNQLRKLKQRYPALKIVWSFGGWRGSAGFGQAATDPERFAASCRELLADERWSGLFDGIDLDWEYPNACGLACDDSGRDALARLARAVRAAVGPDRLVTAAVPADARRIDAADYAAAANDLDWVMAMTYDFAGTDGRPGPTAPHSPLTAYPGAARPGSVTDAAIAKLTGTGIPARKLLLGIGFYGRGWTGVTGPAPGSPATGPAPGSVESGMEDYRVLARSCPPTGTVGGTAYAFCAGTWWSYDTPETIAGKLAYARRQQLGGAFVWELSGDTPSGQLLAAVRAGLG